MSVYYDLLAAVSATVQGLALPGVAQVAIRKLPAIEETLDVLPAIIVCPRENPEQVIRSGFESNVDVVYGVEIIIIAGGNLDFSANLDTYLGWRQQIRRAFQEMPLPNYTDSTGSFLWNVVSEPETPLDRFKVSQLYDYLPLAIRFSVSELSG